MLEGIAAGFILSLSLFPATVWVVKVGVTGRASQVFVVASGFVLSQFFWLSVSVFGLLMMTKHLAVLLPLMHFFATFVLCYMAFKTIRGRRLEVLDDIRVLPSLRILFRDAFNRALAIPMRLPTTMAILLATGVYANKAPELDVAYSALSGGLIGVLWWWGQIFLLTALFVRRVPKHITIKSLNKIRPFCTILFIILGVISLLM